MAKTARTCPACKEATITFTASNRQEVERYADWKIDSGHVCDDCLKRQREEESAKAASDNADAGLPVLKGTEKQVVWAETIRRDILRNAELLSWAVELLGAGDQAGARAAFSQLPYTWKPDDREFQRLGFSDPNTIAEVVIGTCQVLRAQRDAGWWIDSRHAGIAMLVPELIDEVMDRLQSAPTQEEVIDEVAVKPADPVTVEVVEVAVNRRRIAAKLSFKRDDFRAVVKGLGYRWDPEGRVWTLPLGPCLGVPEDRGAELMHRLLDAGFIVSCQRAEVREKALSASYEPIYPRWISRVSRGHFKGWCQVILRDGLDLADDLERLGARVDFYQEGVWYVRPGHYAALRDLSEVHGLRVTPAAEQALAQAQRADEARLLAEDLPEAPQAQAEGNEPGQYIPDGIDPELRDD